MKYKSRSTPSLTLFDFDNTDIGKIEGLPDEIVANGASCKPMLRYRSSDATADEWRPWGYGKRLIAEAEAGGTASRIYNVPAPYLGTSADTGIRLGGDTFYVRRGSTFAAVRTCDFIMEGIAQLAPSTNNGAFFGNGYYPTAHVGVRSRGLGYANFDLYFDVDGGTIIDVNTGALVINRAYHFMIFANRDENSANGVKIFVNGEEKGAGGNISAYSALDLGSSAAVFAIGGDPGVPGTSINAWEETVYYCAMWKKQDWFAAGDNTTEWSAIAKERFYKLSGIYAKSSTGIYVPSTYSRTNCGIITKKIEGAQKHIEVPSSWPLIDTVKSFSSSKTLSGYRSRPAVVNYCTTDGPGSPAGGTVSSNNAIAPTGKKDAYTFVEDAASSTKYIILIGASASKSDRYILNVHLKAEGREIVRLQTVTEDGTYNSIQYVNIRTSEILSVANPGLTNIQSRYLGDGWRKWSAEVYNSTDSAQPITIILSPAAVDGSTTYLGDSREAFHFWKPSLELKTSNTSVAPFCEVNGTTEGVDILEYTIPSELTSSTKIECDILTTDVSRSVDLVPSVERTILNTGPLGVDILASNLRLVGFQSYGLGNNLPQDQGYGYFLSSYNGTTYTGKVVQVDLNTFDRGKTIDLTKIDSNLNGAVGGSISNNFLFPAFYVNNSGLTGHAAKVNVATMDPNDVTVLNITSVNPNAKGFHGSVVSGSDVYYIPHYNGAYHGNLARVDIDDFTTSTVEVLDVASGNATWAGFTGGFAYGDYIYLIPASNNSGPHGNLVRVNTLDFTTVEAIDLATVDAGLIGFAGGFVSGSFAYLSPSYDGSAASKVAKIDLATFATGDVSVLDLSITDADLQGFYDAFVYGDYGYFVPSFYPTNAAVGKIAKVDLTDFTTVTVLNLELTDPDLQSFVGGFAHGGYLYFAPWTHQNSSGDRYFVGKVPRVLAADFATVEVFDLANSLYVENLNSGEGYVIKKNLLDGDIHHISYAGNNGGSVATIAVDDAKFNSSESIPPLHTGVAVGKSSNSDKQFGGIIANLKLFKDNKE